MAHLHPYKKLFESQLFSTTVSGSLYYALENFLSINAEEELLDIINTAVERGNRWELMIPAELMQDFIDTLETIRDISGDHPDDAAAEKEAARLIVQLNRRLTEF